VTFRGFKCAHTPDMKMCLDFDKGTYYLNGVQKQLSDFTAISTGYTSTDMSWFPASDAFTLMVEFSLPDTGLTQPSTQVTFSLYNTSATSSRLDLYVTTVTNNEGGMTFYHQPNAAFINNSNSNQRTLGRKRHIVSFKPGDPLLMALDAQPVFTGATMASNAGFNKWAVGLSAAGDTHVTQATIHKVHIWDGYRSAAQIEAIADFWDCRARPVLGNGSSLNNEQTYANGGGYWSRIFRANKADGYVPFRSIAQGGTGPSLQVATALALPDRYRDFNMVFAEIGLGGLDGIEGGGSNYTEWAQYETALDTLRASWRGGIALVEPQRDLRMVSGSSELALVEEARAELPGYASTYGLPYLTTLSEMQAKDPDDSYVTTHDTWPSSAYIDIVTDPIHWNATGSEWFADVMRPQLRAMRWI
jgi:hypothetical protein